MTYECCVSDEINEKNMPQNAELNRNFNGLEKKNQINLELKKKDVAQKDESLEGLLTKPNNAKVPAKVIPGQRILIREDTVVGCATCSGSKLVGYSKIKLSPSLCWNQSRTTKKSACVMTSIVIVFLLSLIGTSIFFFTDFFNATLLSNMVLVNNSKAFNLWKNPPVHPIMKVHIFNYTNALEVMAGREKKLRVEDVGPYIYRETVSRVNTVFYPNGTLSFQDKRSFQLVTDGTSGATYDKVIVPNLPMLSAISMAKDTYYVAKVGLSTVFTTLDAKPFRELPVHRFLWGYEDELVNLAKPFLRITSKLPDFEKFGILVTRNGTGADVVTINTGEKDMTKFAVIDRYNGYEKLPHWSSEECNRVDASDGSMFPPSMIDRKQPLYIFNQQLCRRLPFIYEKDVEVLNGIKALRYSVPEDVFDSPDRNPANQCFCHMDSGECPPSGVFNSSPCAFGAPAMSSFPHFYLGDPSLTEDIDGLDPTPDKHAMYMDIHPTLGFPLFAKNRLQLNVQLKKSFGITGSGLDFIKNNIYLPVVWLEMTVDELPQEIKTLVYHGTYSANAVRLGLTWGCAAALIISGLLLLIAARSSIRNMRRSRRTPLPVISITTKS